MNFEDKCNEMNINPYELMEKKFSWNRFFTYLLDWRERKAVNLPNWLKKQVEEVNELNILGYELIKPSMEATVVNILNWIHDNTRYTPDKTVWEVEEKWQTAFETFNLRTGDCEDMSILFYVLCRKVMIPANRVRIVAGEVGEGFGHAWAEFLIAPFAYHMDACYYPDLKKLEYRKPYTIGNSKYKKIWFACNETGAWGDLT